MLGRVLSLLYSGLSMMPAMLGVVGSGFLADGIGLTATFVLAGAAIAAIGIAGCCSRSMRAASGRGSDPAAAISARRALVFCPFLRILRRAARAVHRERTSNT